MRATWQFGLLAVALVSPPLAHGDEVHLRGGTKLEGRATRQGDTVVIRLESGEIRLPGDTVERIEHRVSPEEIVEKRRATLRHDDIAGRLELAAYCREHDLPATERALLLEVIDRVSDHAQARRLLGYVKTERGWVERQQQLAAQREAEQSARLERMRAEARDEQRAKTERALQQAELEAQKAREEAARARAEAAAAPIYFWTPAYPDHLDHPHRGRRHRPWAQQSPSRWPINGTRDPRDDTYPLQGYKDPRDWR